MLSVNQTMRLSSFPMFTSRYFAVSVMIFSWFLYAIALVLKEYANRVRFMAFHEMPPIFRRSPSYASKFWLMRLAITYGSLAGLWFAHGWRIAVGAFLCYMLFCVITFVRGSRRAVNKWARVDFERQQQEAAQKGQDFNEVTGWLEASKLAERFVEEHAKRNGNL